MFDLIGTPKALRNGLKVVKFESVLCGCVFCSGARVRVLRIALERTARSLSPERRFIAECNDM